MYRVEKLVHICKNKSEHPNAPYWAHGKWFQGPYVLEELVCQYCEETLADPNECNFILGNIIVTYMQKTIKIPIQYIGLYLDKVDKRKKEFKDVVSGS